MGKINRKSKTLLSRDLEWNYFLWFSRRIEHDISRRLRDIWSVFDDDFPRKETIGIDMYQCSSFLLDTTLVEECTRNIILVKYNTVLTCGTDIFREKNQSATEHKPNILWGIIDSCMSKLPCADIIDRDTIPINRRSIEENKSIANKFCLKYKTRTKVFFSDDIFRTSRWSLVLEGIVTVWIFIGRMSEKLCREFCIHIAFDDHSLIEEFCMCVGLSNFYTRKKWLLVDTEILTSIGRKNRDWKKKKEKKKFSHKEILSDFFEFSSDEWVLVSRIEWFFRIPMMFFDIELENSSFYRFEWTSGNTDIRRRTRNTNKTIQS